MANQCQKPLPDSEKQTGKTDQLNRVFTRRDTAIRLQCQNQPNSDDGRHLPRHPGANALANGHITYPQRPDMAFSN